MTRIPTVALVLMGSITLRTGAAEISHDDSPPPDRLIRSAAVARGSQPATGERSGGPGAGARSQGHAWHTMVMAYGAETKADANGESQLFGDWKGQSIVVAKSSAAKNEVVVWHISKSKEPGKVTVQRTRS